jgi:O-antigen ligase
MQWNTLKALIMFGLAAFMAICLGISVAMGEYRLMLLATGVCVMVALIVFPGYAPLLAFGILCPFAPPLPFVWNFPFVGLILGVCFVKFFVERAIATKPLHGLKTMTWSFAVFFAWVFIRWAMKPTLPNLLGWGQNITGFRAYLAYGLAFIMVFFLGRFVLSRDDLLKLFRSMTIMSLICIGVFVPLVFTKTLFLIPLMYLSVFFTFFDNGMLRFVILPFFGVLVISVSMLPLLFPTTKFRRRLLFLVGCGAVILGGTRSGLLMALAVVFTILFLNRQWIRLALIFPTVGIIAVLIAIFGAQISSLSSIGLLRPLSLISSEIANKTDAAEDWEWRKVRWERGMEEIRLHPLVGSSYGGMENAAVWEAGGPTEEESMEGSLATGGLHNGFLDCAYALGIPAALLFVYILTSRILITGRRAFTLRKSDALMAQVNAFLSANLIALALTVSIGSDVNDKQLWFYLGLTVLAGRLAIKPARAANPMAQPRWEPVSA